MNIDLESCFVCFLIGVAIYLLLNNFFGVEGYRPKPKHGVVPAPSLTPGPSLTPEQAQAKLQDYIDKCMYESVTLWNDFFPNPRLFTKYTRSDFNEISADEFTDFTTLLSNNTGRFLSLKGKSPYLNFGDYGNVLTLSQAVQLVNCFKEDIHGVEFSPIGEVSDLSDINSLNNRRNLKYLKIIDTLPSRITGKLTDLTQLTNLVYLELLNTNITGDISSLSGLTKLQFLKLDGDETNWSGKFTGDISENEGIKKLTNLRYLSLRRNMGISGDIVNLSGLTQLRGLELKYTSFSGDIKSLKDLINLKRLALCPGGEIHGNIFDSTFATNLYMNRDKYQIDLDECLQLIHPIKVDCGDRRFNCNNCSSPTQSSTDPPS